MKMNTFQLIATIVAICFLFGMMSSAQAQIEIIDMYMPSETEDYGYIRGCAYIETDIPYDTVYWYIGDPDDPDNLKYVGETLGDGGATRAWFAPSVSDCPGHVKGRKYRIAAKAWYYNRDTKTSTSDYDSRDFTVYKPIYLYEPGPNTGAYGSVEISRFYYDGSDIIMDASIYAYNPKNNPKAKKPDNNPLSVLLWFRTDKYDAPNGQVDDKEHHRDTKPIEIIQVGKHSQTYNPGPYTDPEPWRGGGKLFDRDVGIIEEDNPLYYNAHAHLQVFGNSGPADNWEVDTEHQTGTTAVTFTWKDGP